MLIQYNILIVILKVSNLRKTYFLLIEASTEAVVTKRERMVVLKVNTPIHKLMNYCLKGLEISDNDEMGFG